MNATTSRFLAVLSAVALLVCSCERSEDDGETTIVAPSSSSSAPAQQTAPAAAPTSTAPVSTTPTSTTPTSTTSAGQTNTSSQETKKPADTETTPSSSGIATRSLPVPPASSATEENTTSATDTGVPGDKVAFGSLIWCWGGIDGSESVPSGVSISGLSFGSNLLSFRYNRDMSAWGYGAGTLVYACLFVKNNNGNWVGGKFDWISSNRASRDLKNVLGGYGGWDLSNVPNPCQAAFVILDKNKKRRSNVLVGSWKR